jgi:hypothetical protein
MSRGKYLSLEEARKAKQLDRFAKEHQSEGDRAAFAALLGAMATKPEKPKKGCQHTRDDT